MKTYFRTFKEALYYAYSKEDLFLVHSVEKTEFGEDACIKLEDDNFKTVEILFYCPHLWEIQPNFVKY
jgi:hypothetical protein